MSVALKSSTARRTAKAIEDARIIRAEVNEDELTVHLEDGRTVVTPLAWYPRLVFATEEELNNFRITGRGYGVHWPELDEDLSVKGMLAGLPSGEGAASLKQWKQEMRRRRREGITGPWASANRATYEAHDYPEESEPSEDPENP